MWIKVLKCGRQAENDRISDLKKHVYQEGFPGCSDDKESACSAGDPGSILAMSSSKESLDWEDPLEKEMAIHSSILAWRIPWTEELVGSSQ